MPFDEKYKLYLDWTAQTEWVWDNDTDANWVEIFEGFLPHNKSLVEAEMFLRWKWNEITIRNHPKRYTDTSNDAFRLYDLLDGLDPTQEIRVKLVTDDNTVRGYFGNNDGKFNDNRSGKVLKVTPAILDQYTNVIENTDKKIDVIGIRKSTTARFDLDDSVNPIAASHNVPMNITSSDIDETQKPGLYDSPSSGGAFLNNLKTAYEAKFSAHIEADFIITPGFDMSVYIREYNSVDVVIQESLLATYSSSGSISTTFEYSPTLSKDSYIVLEWLIDNAGDSVTYGNVTLRVGLENIPFDTITIEVELLSSNLIAKDVWTEPLHARTSPKESEWSSTNGVDDYFEVSGAPKASLFSDIEFGPNSQAGALFSNGLDISNEPIEGTYLGELETLLGDFEYELSSVTVWEGTTYRNWWPFGKKYRRVYGTCTFSREEYWKIDEGAPDPPPGGGWEQTTIMQGGKRLWIRKPFNGAVTDWNLDTKDSSGGNNGSFEWVSKKKTVRAYDPSENSRTFDSARDLKEVIKTIYNGMHSTLNSKDVISTFFWNDDEGDLDVLDSWPSGTNYLTFQPNELNRIGCIHTADFDTDESELNSEDQTLKISFKDIISDLRKFWDIYWFVDLDGNLHIEHKKYIDLTSTSVDARGNKFLKETLKWGYNKEIMFAAIEYSSVNSGYRDFTDNIIEFNKIASNKRNRDLKLELKTEILSTDIKYCIENPGDLQNGLTLVVYDTSFKMITDYVPLLQKTFENGPIALSNLLLKYWTYEGVWSAGKINNVDAEFTVTYRTKLGKEIDLQNIYDVDGGGDEIRFITTDIGVGMVKSMTPNFNNGTTTKIVLVYRYDSSPETDVFELIAATDVLYDFGNY